MMKLLDFITTNLVYIAGTEPGSILDTVKWRQPEIQQLEMNTDLHAHPRIRSRREFFETLDAMVDHNVEILAITTHEKGVKGEKDFWQVKDLVREMDLPGYDDLGLAFNIKHGGKVLTLVGATEVKTRIMPVNGLVDVLALMPDRGLSEHVEQGMPFRRYVERCREYNAICIGAHLYTIHDPEGVIPFRLATLADKSPIKHQAFIALDGVDCPSSNTGWMLASNRMLTEDYVKRTGRLPLGTSDAHGTSRHTRYEIGRGGTIFQRRRYATGEELRENLRGWIRSGDYRPYCNPTPSLQFVKSIALEQPAVTELKIKAFDRIDGALSAAWSAVLNYRERS
jgi:hypothetical protein